MNRLNLVNKSEQLLIINDKLIFLAQLITEETKESKDKSQKINETIIGLEEVNKKNDNLKNSTLIQETKNWLTLDGITSLHL